MNAQIVYNKTTVLVIGKVIILITYDVYIILVISLSTVVLNSRDQQGNVWLP